MLLTVLDRFRSVPSRFFMSPYRNIPKQELIDLGLARHFPLPVSSGGRLFPPRFLANLAISSVAPRALCDRIGLARYQDSDGLLDISGIRFGDAASPTAGRNFIRLARYYKRRGKPVILLPQMLGPFKEGESADLFRRLLPETTLVFARDGQSYEHALSVLGPTPKLRLAPDITIFCEPTPSPQTDQPYGCIVPNARMLDRGKADWHQTYVDRLVAAAQSMIALNLHPIVLVHSTEGLEDNPLAERIVQRLGPERCSMQVADDPLQTKAFIANARLIVASRYHSVVSALSSGVPAIVMGWAHKYDTLLKDFGVPHLQHFASDSLESLGRLVAEVGTYEESQRLKKILLSRRAAMSAPNEEMWRLVAGALSLDEGSLLRTDAHDSLSKEGIALCP